jgi:SAM-dependent methyltransferase
VIGQILKEISRGKTPQRTYQNLAFREVELNGKVLDVAGGRNPSFKRFVRGTQTGWVVAEIDPKYRPDLCFDASGRWPVPDESYDCVLLINCLYLLPDPAYTVREAARVAAKGGTVVFSAPFLWNESKEPTDFFRFTADGAAGLAEKGGLTVKRVIPYGGRFISALDLVFPYLRGVGLGLPSVFAAHLLDGLARRYGKFEARHPAPCGHLVVAQKE